MGATLILEKLFSRPSFYDTACFSILASGPHLDATIISENFLGRLSIDAITFNYRPLIWCFSWFRRLFQLVQDSAFNQMFKRSLILAFFRMVHNEKNFQKVQR